DVLTLADGQPVRDARTWFDKRRPEILRLFQTEIFGRVPERAPKVKWTVASTDPNARDGSAILQQVVGQMGDRPDGPRIQLSLNIPAQAKGPVPVILSISFGGGAGGKVFKFPVKP